MTSFKILTILNAIINLSYCGVNYGLTEEQSYNSNHQSNN